MEIKLFIEKLPLIETEEPYIISVRILDGSSTDIIKAQVNKAIRDWAGAVEADGYRFVIENENYRNLFKS
jgi:hypothetical protein